MEDHRRSEYKQRTRLYIKLYTFLLLAIVGLLGVLFQREIAAKFRNDHLQYIDISFSVYGGLVGSMLNLLVYLPMTFRHLRSWTEEDREAHFCWMFLRPLLGGLSGFVSYGFVNALPIQLDMGEGQRIFWFMFCVSVFAGFKSEEFILRFSQRFETIIPVQKGPKAEANGERVIPFRRRARSHRSLE
jgi:hypothetical protein